MVKHPVFLSPFEEYGVISVGGRGDASGENKPLPSPLEVDRFISTWRILWVCDTRRFPSPLEVDRFISGQPMNDKRNGQAVSVPSRGR